MFTAALACAALLMSAPVPTTVVALRDVPRHTVEFLCGPGCVALTWPMDDGTVLVATSSRRFEVLVHENCHVVQLYEGRSWRGPAAEAECHAVMRLTDRC